ncbi:MAG: UDP-N-acetylmuramoyl-L-alanine--D-glutamate ligase [Sphingomonas sp.]|uniref:UDP-N-acetylmuramoyl-L-alanine--D-glutamate ligase n=1 Tax=Sphingomonas sp. TaxID=28214 RepID=UPI003F80B9DA
MITSPSWRGKRYAVLGLARSGAATVRALLASGADVVTWDQDETKRKAVFDDWLDDLIVNEPGTLEMADPVEIDLTGFAGVVVSPGVPLNRHPIAAKAREAGVPIIGDIELFAQAREYLRSHRVVGITGTNGKSTTTALIHHILETAGIPARMGGNIGLPILGEESLPVGGVYVLELSSYQIDLTVSLDCDVAVLLNVTPDHLDRYDGFGAYAASKARLFAMQSKDHDAVIGIGDDASARIARSLSARGEHLTKIAPGACMDQSRWPSLQGPHNAQNALAAIAACQALGVPEAAIDAGLESFKGLPHRMERVGTVGGVAYINDSKATNPESTAPALAAFDNIHWIVGGKAKTDNLDACEPYFDHVRMVYTIGEAGPAFYQMLHGKLVTGYYETLANAVAAAHANAEPGETVLLSPACASFDQFRDYEERGDTFRGLVEALP